MGKYTNPVDITSGRRLHVAEPLDDRVVFNDVADVEADKDLGRTTAWYSGLVALMHAEHGLYVWRLSNHPDNANHPEETNPNPNVDYSQALLSQDFRYDDGFPNESYAEYYFNWYPFNSAGLYNNNLPVTATNLEGWPTGSIPGLVTFQYMWDTLLYPYTPPLITLSGNPSPGYREKGVIIDAVTLSGVTTQGKNPITIVKFYRDGNLLFTNFGPNPSGGTETYLESNDIGLGVNPPDVYFQTDITDGITVKESNKIWYRSVYPFYAGASVSAEPSESAVKAMTKIVTPKGTITHEYNFSQSRYVFAYPQSYGPLVSIFDKNGYETIDDYRINGATFTMLDGNSVAYYIYVFEVPGYEGALTDAVNFNNTFIF